MAARAGLALAQPDQPGQAEIEGVQLSGTCACTGLLTLLNTVCIGVSCA